MPVKSDGKEIFVEATERNFPQKKHALLQAVMSVSDMFMHAQSKVASVFLDDIEEYFSQNLIRFTPAVQFIGKSGFPHTYDFVIPASSQKPERLIRAINIPTKEKAESALFAWSDTREMRRGDSSMIVFLNDFGASVRSGVADAFLEYGVTPILWTKRESFTGDLAS